MVIDDLRQYAVGTPLGASHTEEDQQKRILMMINNDGINRKENTEIGW